MMSHFTAVAQGGGGDPKGHYFSLLIQLQDKHNQMKTQSLLLCITGKLNPHLKDHQLRQASKIMYFI